MSGSKRTGLLSLGLCAILLAASAWAEQRGVAVVQQTVSTGDRPEVFVQVGHADIVTGVAFSPDGHQVLSASKDATLKLWDAASGRLVRTFTGHDGGAVAFSSDGRRVLSGDGAGILKVWDVATGREVRTFTVGSVLAFSPDGRQVLSGSQDQPMKLWDVASGKLVRTFTGHGEEVLAVAFSPDGRQVLASSRDRTLKLWDAASGKLMWTFTEHSEELWDVAFSPDGRSALSVSMHYTIKLWEVATGREVRTFTWPGVNTVAFSPDGRHVLSGNVQGAMKLWDVASGKLVRTFTGHDEFLGHVHTVAFSPDGRQVLSGSDDKTLKLWDVATGREVRTFTGHASWVKAVAFSPDGRWVLSGGSDLLDGRALTLWDMAAGRAIRSFHAVSPVAFSRDGRQALLGAVGGTLKLWDVGTGQEIRTFTGHDDGTNAVAFSPDGRWVLSGGRALILWDVSTGREVRTFNGHDSFVRAVAFSPDGRQVLSGSDDKTLKLWDVATGRTVQTFTGHDDSVVGGAFSPDGRQVLSGSWDETLKLWNVGTGREVRTFTHDGSVNAVAFSPDGRWVLSGGRALILWDVSTGREVRTFKGHDSFVQAVAFSPDGRRVLSGGDDGTVRAWQTSSGQEQTALVALTDGEWVAITPSGYYTASEKGGQYLNVRIGSQVYGIDNFFEQFYRPDVVAEVLRTGESDATVLARLGENGRVNFSQAVKLPPRVAIVSPKPGESFDRDDVEVQVQAEDQGGGVDEIQLYHNSKVVGGETRGVKVNGPGPALRKTFRVRLVGGANRFRAVALSTDRIEGNPAELTIQLTTVAKAATLHLLLVGINEYKNPALNLNYALPDAQGLLKFFTARPATLFTAVKRYELYDKAATKAAIVAHLQTLQQSAPQDVVVIYLAGHGESLENTWYFIPWEITTPEREEVLKAQGLSSVELKEQIGKIGAQKVLVLMDACKSGSAMLAFAGRGVEDRKALAQLARSTGVHIMAASTKDQLAAEVKAIGHGVFTYTLLEGLSGKADGSPKDGAVTVRELLSYVDSQLPEISAKYKQQAQYPVVDSRGQDFPLASVR